MTNKQLAEALRREKLPQCCTKHIELIWYDEPCCPACRLLWENGFRRERWEYRHVLAS